MRLNEDFTPYSTVIPLVKEVPAWLTDEHSERIASYLKYEEIYWQDPRAFKLVQRGTEAKPIYVPNAKQIVDSTAHYLLKGLKLNVDGENEEFQKFLDKFLKRERFYSRFMIAKSAGVTRGDWIFHITADESEPEGSRLSLTSVDPGAYFPVFDPDDDTKRIEVHLAQQVFLDDIQEWKVKQKSYWYEGEKPDRKVVWSEAYLNVDGWGTERETTFRTITPPTRLADNITKIPVYHFKNIGWDGWDFGASEIKGYEAISAAINQAVTDEDVALALQGLGVYATDAGPPRNATTGEIEDWEIAPARVMEVPSGAYFRRVEGMTTVEPSQSHIGYLEDKLFETSSTFRAGVIDVQVAESGIALAIKFLPELAKIEHRDLEGIATLDNLFYDLKQWFEAYEPGEEKLRWNSKWMDVEIKPELGMKLPQNRVEITNELNNMLDRKIISRAYYRREMRKLGYEFDEEALEKEILEEKEADIELQRKTALATAQADPLSSGGNPENKSENKSNNANRPNESKGTESKA